MSFKECWKDLQDQWNAAVGGSRKTADERCQAAVEDGLERLPESLPAIIGSRAWRDPQTTKEWLEAMLKASAEVKDAYEQALQQTWAPCSPASATVEWTEKPADRQWLIPEWLPAARVGLLTGKGGAGKTRLALQLAAAMAEGRKEWLPGGPGLGNNPETPPPTATAVFATWEDEPDEFARRLRGILGDPNRLAGLKNRLHVLDYAGCGPLWAPVEQGSRHTSTVGTLTDRGKGLRHYCEQHKALLLIIDPLAAAYLCNENDRGLVRQFMSDWDGWSRKSGCTVLIAAHPSKAHAEYSGSTDWQAAARYVWTLGSEPIPTPEDGGGKRKKTDQPEAPRLRVLKTSYSSGERTLWLTGWPEWKAVSSESASESYSEFYAVSDTESREKHSGAKRDDKKVVAGETDDNPYRGWV